VCGLAFPTSTHLRNHTRKHQDLKPHKCHLCSEVFSHSSSLDLHIRVHSGEKPFECEVCRAHFRSRRDQLAHTRLHASSKQHRCHHCLKPFKSKKYAEKHQAKCAAREEGSDAEGRELNMDTQEILADSDCDDGFANGDSARGEASNVVVTTSTGTSSGSSDGAGSIVVTADTAEVLDKTIALIRARRQSVVNAAALARIQVTAMSEEF